MALGVLALIYALCFDFWNWEDEARVWGLPRFIFYIFTMQIVLTAAMYLFARYFWPGSRSRYDKAREERQ